MPPAPSKVSGFISSRHDRRTHIARPATGVVQSDRIGLEDTALRDSVLAGARRLLNVARSARMVVIHVAVIRPQFRGTYDALRSATAINSGRAPRDAVPLASGTLDVVLVLPPLRGEEFVRKVCVSAFQNIWLDSLLRNARVDEIYIAGAFAHMVVESTASQGFDPGYKACVVQDACCAPMLVSHINALATGIPNFARIASSAEAADEFRLSLGAT